MEMLAWEKLYKLQQMEKAIEAKNKNKELLSNYNSLKKEKEVIQKEINITKETKINLESLIRDIRQLEKEIDDIKKLAEEHERKLYSGDITNNKELVTAKEHLDQYQSSIISLEETLLKLMEEQEQLTKDIEARSSLIRRNRDKFSQDFNEYQALKEKEIKEISEQVEEIFKLKQLLAVEARESLKIYEEFKKKYASVVIVKLDKGICSGCHMGVSFEVMKELRKLNLNEPVYCNNCGRIVIQ